MRRTRVPRPAAVTARLWPCAAAIVLAGALVYANALGTPFVFDDGPTVVDNASIRTLASSAVLAPAVETPSAGRPLVNLSLAVDYAIGELSPFGYHVTNLALHLCCGVLLFACVRRTIELPRMPAALRARSIDVACAAALLWTLHPLNSEVVDYVTQRTESLMTLCYLLTIYASVRARGPAEAGPDDRRVEESALDRSAAVRWQTVAVVACALGMLGKESMATAPLAVWMYDRSFVFESGRDALRRRWRFYATLAATWAVLAAANWSGPRRFSAGLSSGVDSWTYLLNQTLMLARYARLVVWPTGQVVAYGPPVPITLADVWPYAIVTALAVLAAVWLWITKPGAGFALAFVFVALSPTSSLVPIATEVGAERRMYLPLAAMVAAVVAGIVWLAPRRRKETMAALASLCVILAGLTFVRNREYATPLTLAETVLDRWPTGFAHAMVGRQLAVAGRHDEAIAHLRQAVPTYPPARYHLGGELFNQGAVDAAVVELDAFVRDEGWRAEAVPARLMIGRGRMLKQDYPAAIDQFRRVLAMTRAHEANRVTATGFLAASLFARQEFAEAQPLYAAYLADRPTDAGATTNLAITLSALGRVDDAVAAFRRAVELNPRDEQARRNLAIALEDQRAAASARGRR